MVTTDCGCNPNILYTLICALIFGCTVVDKALGHRMGLAAIAGANLRRDESGIIGGQKSASIVYTVFLLFLMK